MDDNESSRYSVPIPMIVERRRGRGVEWSSAEVMKILRRRAAAKAAAARKAEEAITVK